MVNQPDRKSIEPRPHTQELVVRGIDGLDLLEWQIEIISTQLNKHPRNITLEEALPLLQSINQQPLQ